MVLSQEQHFPTEVALLKAEETLPLFVVSYLDSDGILRVGGRESNAKLAYSIRSEHLRLLHARPTLLSASLNRRFHIIYLRKIVRLSGLSHVSVGRVAVLLSGHNHR